jgi:signal peptidase I
VPSPELPEDRRPPRRPDSSVGERPVDRVPGTGVEGAPFPGPNGVAPGYGDFWGDDRRGFAAGAQDDRPTDVHEAVREPYRNGGRALPPNGSAPRNGFGPHGPGPASSPPAPGPHRNGGRPNGAPPTGRPAQPHGPSADGAAANVPEPPLDGSEDDTAIDPQLRVEPASDPEGIPGRHRRRAGASPDSKSAADYVKTGGKKQKSGRRRRSTFWKELPILIGVALVLTILIQAFLAKVYVIPSGSMETTLHGCTGCTNDRVLVDKVTYRFTDPAPGDVVVFRGPDSWVNTEFTVQEPTSTGGEILQQFLSLIGLAPPDEKDFVKRVIAVGGQTVACCDSRNRVMVDGQPLDEPYIYYLPEAGPARQIPFGPITVPAGELWVMGDSRNNSSDSRIDGHGPIPVANVIGKARMKVLPISRFGFIDSTNPQTSGVNALGDAGPPLALGVVGVLPFWLVRRRSRVDDEFLPRRRR